jgi:hypothetical protein
VKKDCLVWEKIMKEDAMKSKPKAGMNLVKVDWD